MIDTEREPVPPATGAEIRRRTRDLGRRRSQARPSELFENVYTAALAVAMAGSSVFSLSSWVGGTAQTGAARGFALEGGWVVVLGGSAAVLALWGLAIRLGPLSVTAEQANWWLSLRSERRGLLRPIAWRWPLVAVGVGATVGIAIGLATGGGPGVLALLAVAGTGSAVTGVGLAGLGQPVPRHHRLLRVATDAALAAVAPVAVLLAAGGLGPPSFAASGPGWAFVASVTAILVLVLWDGRLAETPAAVLRSGGAATGEALVTVLSLDPRGLGQALAARTEPARRRRSAGLGRLLRSPPGRRPVAALVVAEWWLFVRSPRRPVQVVIGACLPALALLDGTPVPWVVLVCTMAGAYLSAISAVEGARRAWVNPALDALLPLSQRAVRRARLVLPALVMLVWSGAVGLVLGWRLGDPSGWVILMALGSPVWAAAAVRAAYRPLPDFSAPLVDSPLGPVPTSASAVAAKGPDVAVLGSIPLATAILTGRVPLTGIVIQVLLTVVLVLLASRPGSHRR